MALCLFSLKGLNKVYVFTGKDEEQEQAGAAAPGDHQRVCDESGREDQRCGSGVAPYHREEVGSITQELHPGKTHIQKNPQHLTGPWSGPTPGFITQAPVLNVFSQEFSRFWYCWLCSFHFYLLFIPSTLSLIFLVVNKKAHSEPNCSLQWP